MRVSSSVLASMVVGLLAVQATHAGATYTAVLSGAAEVPVNASPGTGFAQVELDTIAHTLTVDASFAGLLGTTTASHIHAPTLVPLAGTAGVATETPFFVGFPIGVTSGTYLHTFDTTLTSTWNAPFVTANGGTALGAEAALAADLEAGKAYLNIHTGLFPGGEIRGFLVPEPSTIALIGVAAIGLFARPRRVQQLAA